MKSPIDGITLHNYRYPAKNNQAPKCVIVYFHSWGSYVGREAHVAKAYADQGYDFIGVDYRGFGKSGGPKGVVKSLD